ncbi:MAG: PKD domain-containing protein [Phaeodactylibacter sp.]|nr:PKD domain-containing protein [Phaeodactylibacter sp.]MCB9049145.1 PKD domain-containing protein [Lewinellaceae bacterium]
MPKIRFALGIAFLLWSAGALSGQCDIADQCGDLQPQGGFGPNSPTFFCEGEEVEFINNSDPNLVDTTIIDWGDGQVDRAPGTPSFTHTYDFAEDTCLVSASSVTIPITMTVVNRCPSGVSRNCLIVFVRIRVNPVAIFDEPEALCVGEVANFMNASCDNGETVTYEWTFEGNGTSTDENPSVIYNQRGFYDIGLRVTNQCGTDFTQETIEIRDVPIAAATSQISNDSACIPALIQFMNNSIDEDFYEWQFFPSQGVVFLDSTETGFFPEGGHYQALLIAENTCGIDTARLNFEVFEPPSLLLGPAPPPGCDTLVFTPDITYEGSISSLEWAFPGSNIALTTDSFPTVIYTDDGVYPYTLNVSGPCGAFSIRDTVQVLALEEVAFDSIGLVCNSTDPFPIPASPPLGVWSGPGVGSNGLFDPAAANIGTNVLTYVAGAAGCESTGQLTIEVEEAADVDIGTARDTFCVDAGQVTFSFSPIGGAWSGTGIVDPSQGVFDPQLAGPGTYNLSYVFGDAIGCVIRKTKNVRVEALPDITLNGMPSTCAVSDNISLSDVVNFQATPGGTLTWSGDGVLNPSGQFNSDSLFGAMSADITLTNTSAFGCVTSQTFTLELRDYIQAQAAEPEVTACSGSAPLMLSATPGNGQWAGPQANANTGEVLISQLSPGTYFYIYTIDPNTPCESRDTVELTVLDAANSVTLGQDVYACADDNVVPLPTASPMNGDWTGPSPASNGQVDVQLLPGPGEYIYTYTVDALPDACNSAEITFTVLPLPEPAFTFDSLACEGAPVSFTNETANADVFSWDFGDGSPLSNEVSPQHAFGQSNTFTVMLTAESLNPLDGSVVCSAQLDQDIYVSQAPELVAFNTDVVEGCAPLAVSFDNQSVGDNLSFIWNFGGLDTSFVDEPGLFTFPQGIFGDTSYTVTLSVANGCGDAVDTTQILVFPQPQANFGITFNELCSGDTLYLNNISTGNPDQYFWFMNSRTLERIYSIPDPPPVVPFSDVTADTLSVLLIAQNGCGSDSLEQLVTVNPSDVSALINTSTRELCVNDTVRLESFSTPGAPVRWTISDGNVYTGTVVQHSFAAPGVYNVSLYAEGCGADSMAVQIAVLPLPDVALNFSPTVCAENPLRFDVVTNGDGQVLYFGDGDSTLSSVAQHIYDTPGTYFPTVTVTSAQGCRNTWNGIALEVAPLPVVAIAEVDSVCQGAPVNFRSLSIGNTSCLWLFGDGNGSDACEAIHTFQSSGVFDASLIAVSSLGCRDSLKQPVYVRPRPEADFEVSLEDICTPATVLFSDNSTGATGLSWELGDGSTGTASEFSHIYETAGDYEARLIVSNEGICRDTTTQQFTLYSPPEGNFELIETCTQAEGHTLLVEAEPQDFVVLNGRDYNQAGTRHERLAAGSYTLELESPQGCYTTREIVVPQVQELIALLFQDSFAIELGQSVDLLVNINQAGTQIRWSPAMSLSDTSITDPVATPFSTTTYVVEVTNDKGCVKRDTALVRVAIDRERGIFIPNAFTPDGSGHNDVFRILSTNVGLVKVPVFRVFDRWGELMFEALDCPASELQNCGWDGNFKGQKAEQGVYTYYAELLFTDSFLRVAKGNVTLIR